MDLKPLLCAGVLAACAGVACADDQSALIPFVSNVPGSFSAGWGTTHLSAGAFTDTFTSTLVNGSNLVFDGSFVTIGFSPVTDIDFTSVSVNGHAYSLNTFGAGRELETAQFEPFAVNSPLLITVSGIAGPSLSTGTPINASYAGTANVTAVPEPRSLALMLAGIGVIGSLSRRRLPR